MFVSDIGIVCSARGGQHATSSCKEDEWVWGSWVTDTMHNGSGKMQQSESTSGGRGGHINICASCEVV